MKNLKLHPISIQSLKKSHPWVTRDEYSEKFPQDKEILDLYDGDNFLGQFLHDPEHPRVVARFWSAEKSSFEKTLLKRLDDAIAKRKINDRENYYFVFGEADQLPGLFIQKLGSIILIQYQAFFWEKWLKKIVENISSLFSDCEFWEQKRIPQVEKKPPRCLREINNHGEEFLIEEFGIRYKIKFNENHDIGLYTDMSEIRKKVQSSIKKAKRVLNLFSYTGAYSLMPLSMGAEVTSVDLSRKYMDWLENNIELNSFDQSMHHSVVSSVEKYIAKACSQGNRYDAIICDPPSFSFNGKKRVSSLQFYKNYFQQLTQLLSPSGKLILFLNTYSLNRTKFKQVINQLKKADIQIEQEFFLSNDCPLLKHFPEGDYLKGLCLKKK
ncbi:MAG: class I SAM-dependent rRNA methyltransferase [Halobacteriovoraceae bacterium]|nr:class I SAM-dependent rRNA methyltransferase [Halobacteriovoraceae bacterium]MCB9093873.1 class I SAM-dependent rRNA methyltransferase [Halobacteriovoraceae bacterium]